jgi:hypothetical protein
MSTLALLMSLVAPAITSGLNPGEQVVPFHPNHVAGPLANSTNCFPCTFQKRPQVQIWVNNENPANVIAMGKALDKAMGTYSGAEFKGLIVVVSEPSGVQAKMETAKRMVSEAGLTKVGVAVIGSDSQAIRDYKINLDGTVKNTVFVYKDWVVKEKFVNMTSDDAGIKSLNTAIGRIAN